MKLEHGITVEITFPLIVIRWVIRGGKHAYQIGKIRCLKKITPR